ncbi:pyruvate kinase [Dehalobacter sp. DCM]|uniref:pyruvate kinase n=1 Tax=Dehalobacter sp. DCM TaxID=2907827 RepID=UPI0030820736|nr:pyruvate kinase [Dehalobacter sp. DCM]
MRRTKIICTIGPASEQPDKIRQLIKAGMNVARLNFSHGTHEEHGRRIAALRAAADDVGVNLGILLDTKGPEIRTGLVPEQGVLLENGSKFILDSDNTMGSSARVYITHAALWSEVSPGNHILIDDGLLDLEVTAVAEGKITTTVCNGGTLKSQKGVNVPGVKVDLPALTAKDIEDITFGLQSGIDFIAASFTQKAADILDVRRIVENAESDVRIIAKIESHEGIANIDSILEVVDGIMVARGDLGVEIPVEEVPLYQKEIIAKCNALGKIVIVATQMLDSMIRQPRPTRAEASDVANAILDGTDAIMLSGETAAGAFPVEAVQTMDKIARKAEGIYFKTSVPLKKGRNIVEAIGHASTAIAADLNAASIITPTQSGRTARMISRHRPQTLIIATTPYPEVARSLSLSWGVHTILVSESAGTDQLLSVAVTKSLDEGLVQTGDIVVLTAGVPVGKVGATNLIKVQVVGSVMARGTGIGRKSYSGKARKTTVPEEFSKGDILIATITDTDTLPVIAKAGAIVVERGGLTSHAAIVALQYGIPAVVGAQNATEKIPEGTIITVDALSGVVYEGAVSIL